MVDKRTKIMVVVLSLVLASFMLGVLARHAAAVDEKRGELHPKGDVKAINFERNEITTNGEPPAPPRNLILYQDPVSWDLLATHEISIYILNETEAIKGMNANWSLASFSAKLVVANVTSHSWPKIDYDVVTTTWGVENFTTISSEGETLYGVVYYIVLINEANVFTQYSVKWATPNPVIASFNDMFENLVYIVLFICGAALLIRNRAERKRTQFNYGLGLIAGGVATFVWKAFYYWRGSDPRVSWNSIFSYPEMPNVLGFSGNILAFVSFVCLGVSVMFMSNTVERDIQSRKVPFLTYILVATELAIITFALLLKVAIELQGVFIVIMYAFIAAFIIVAANVLITYIKLARDTTGNLRRKAILIMLSLIMVIGGLVLREFLRPVFVPNMMATVFTLVLYKAITM